MRQETMRAKNVWTRLQSHLFPALHGLLPEDRDGFVLLDTYLCGCLEEWFISSGQLSLRSIILLDGCTRTITKCFRLLDSEGQSYFGQFRKLTWQILHGTNVDQAYRRTKQDWIADPATADVFESSSTKWCKREIKLHL